MDWHPPSQGPVERRVTQESLSQAAQARKELWEFLEFLEFRLWVPLESRVLRVLREAMANRELLGLRAAVDRSARSVLQAELAMWEALALTEVRGLADLLDGGRTVLMVRRALRELPLQEQLHQSQVLQELYHLQR